jgi:hypothetical protein
MIHVRPSRMEITFCTFKRSLCVRMICLEQVKIVDNGVNDIRIVGTIALIVMQCIIIIGTEWESKVWILLLRIYI